MTPEQIVDVISKLGMVDKLTVIVSATMSFLWEYYYLFIIVPGIFGFFWSMIKKKARQIEERITSKEYVPNISSDLMEIVFWFLDIVNERGSVEALKNLKTDAIINYTTEYQNTIMENLNKFSNVLEAYDLKGRVQQTIFIIIHSPICA